MVYYSSNTLDIGVVSCWFYSGVIQTGLHHYKKSAQNYTNTETKT